MNQVAAGVAGVVGLILVFGVVEKQQKNLLFCFFPWGGEKEENDVSVNVKMEWEPKAEEEETKQILRMSWFLNNGHLTQLAREKEKKWGVTVSKIK